MIFVTGGTGFLGRHLIQTMCRVGFPLRVLTRQAEANRWLCIAPGVEVVRGDLTSGEGLDAVQGCDYAIHAAGLFSMWNMAGDFDATNVSGTENLLAVATHAN